MGTAEAAELIPSGVYRIDLGNEWVYVGSACNLRKREIQHRGDLNRGSHDNPVVQRVFDKYGKFVFTVLGRYPVDEILEQEQLLLDEYHGGAKCANIAPTAGNCRGIKRSDQARAKMSAAKIGKKRAPRTAEQCAAISVRQTGKKATEATRAKLRAANLGRKASDATRAKMSASGIAWRARRREAAAAAL